MDGMREDRWLINVTIDGQPTGGAWDECTGGDISSSSTKYRPGGMVPEIDLGGPTTIANMTVARVYSMDRGDHALAKKLSTRCGKARVVVSQQPLDINGSPFGDPIIRGGTLSKVNYPDAKSTGSGASQLQLEISTDGTVG